MFFIKRNDRSPDFEATLEAPAGTPVNLSGATVKFLMKLQGSSTLKVNATATVVDETVGEVKYSFVGTDTDTSGLYVAEFEVTFAGGIKRTFPSDEYLYVQVLDDLG